MDEHLPLERNFHVVLLFDAIVLAARMKDFQVVSNHFQKITEDPHLNRNGPIHQRNPKLSIHPQNPLRRSLKLSLDYSIVLAGLTEGFSSVPVGPGIEPAKLS